MSTGKKNFFLGLKNRNIGSDGTADEMARNFVNIINHLSDIKGMIHDNLCDNKSGGSDADDTAHAFDPAGRQWDGTVVGDDDLVVSETENENWDRPSRSLTRNSDNRRSSLSIRERR